MTKLTSKSGLLLLLLLYFSFLVEADFHVSALDMENIYQQEKMLSKSLKIYIRNMEFNLGKLGEELQSVLHKQQDLINTPRNNNFKNLLQNMSMPLTTLKVMREYFSSVDRSRRIVKDSTKLQRSYRQFLKKIEHQMPTKVDMYAVTRSISRLLRANKLNVVAVANGISVPHGAKSQRMDSSELFYLAKAAYAKKKFREAKNWFELTLVRMAKEESYSLDHEERQRKFDIHDHLAYIDFKLGYIKSAWNHSKQMLDMDPTNERAISYFADYDKILNKEIDVYNDIVEVELAKGSLYDNFISLCNKTTLDRDNQTEKLNGMLNCGYKRDHPLLKLKPAPYEVVSVRPYIVMFHNVMSPVDISAIKMMTVPKLGRPMATRWVDNHYTSEERANAWAWLNGNSKAVSRLNRYAEALSGLSTEYSSSVQVTRNGLGNYHVPHFDWLKRYDGFSPSGYKRGDRLATLMLYLNEPEVGGDCLFVNGNLKIQPVEGSAVFWYNLYRSGYADYSTEYGSCPVQSGSKWVLHKWFYTYGQEFLHPCSLDQSS